MKDFRYLILGAVLVLVAFTPLYVAAQQQPAQPGPTAPAPATQQAPGGAQQAPAAADRTFEGQLAKVDPKAMEIVLTGTGNKQMTFAYTDTTQMVGVEKNNIQGLASKPGTNLKITYRDVKGVNQASKIEVVPPPKQ